MNKEALKQAAMAPIYASVISGGHIFTKDEITTFTEGVKVFFSPSYLLFTTVMAVAAFVAIYIEELVVPDKWKATFAFRKFQGMIMVVFCGAAALIMFENGFNF